MFILGRHLRFRSATPTSYWTSLVKLIFHLLGTALIFLVFTILTWGISYSVSGLNGIHQFPPEVLGLITVVEMWLMYIDIGLCGVVLIVGTFRFCIELLENRDG